MKIQRLVPRLMLWSLIPTCLFLLCLPVFAEEVPEVLRPPKGAQIAIVVFEDLQCPQCGRVAPLLARDFTVVCPDLSGYGESSKPPTALVLPG